MNASRSFVNEAASSGSPARSFVTLHIGCSVLCVLVNQAHEAPPRSRDHAYSAGLLRVEYQAINNTRRVISAD
jgi:hypothetical protein